MSLADIITLIGRTNKISLAFFVITCVLLVYEFYLYMKDKNGGKKPSIPGFKKATKEPLSIHTPKPMPAPPVHPSQKAGVTTPLPPLIAKMSPPTMNHAPGAKKKKKLSRGAKVTIGATLALMVLTVGIAWRLNQPSQQQATNTTFTRADDSITPGAEIPVDSTTSAQASRPLIPTITPRPDLVDLTSVSPTPTVSARISPSPLPSPTVAAQADREADSSDSADIAEIATLPVTGGNSTVEATIQPTLPIAGTIQYSLGLLVIASAIVVASLIF